MSAHAPPYTDELGGQDGVRLRIISAGGALLAKSGRDALTTRAVAALAGVQAPTIYRLFGDKVGLLEAVAEHVLQQFVHAKATHVKRDPLEDLRLGWDLNIAFGLRTRRSFRSSTAIHKRGMSRLLLRRVSRS